jgi:hypothetical protein
VLVEVQPGRELTAVMATRPSPSLSCARARFYDYEAKYTEGITEHLVLALILREVYEQARHWALMAHQALGCSGLTAPICAGRGPPERRAWSCSTQHPARQRRCRWPEQAVGRHQPAESPDLDDRSRGIRHERASPSKAARRASRLQPAQARAHARPAGRSGASRCCWSAVLLLGAGGGGGWWAWREGWLVRRRPTSTVTRSVVAASRPQARRRAVEGRDYVSSATNSGGANVGRRSPLGIDLQTARKRLEANDCGQCHVEGVHARHALRDAERRAVAIWRTNEFADRQEWSPVRASRMPPGAESLPLLGARAPGACANLLLPLANEPAMGCSRAPGVGRPAPLNRF